MKLSQKITDALSGHGELDLTELEIEVSRLERIKEAAEGVLIDWRKRVHYSDWPEIIVKLSDALKATEER